MLNLIKMDFNTLQLKDNKKYLLIMAITPLILFRFIPGFSLEESFILLSYGFIFLISVYTLGHEKPKSHYLINSLPISKFQVVLGKYVFIHLCLLFSLIYLTVYLILLKFFGIITLDNFDIKYLKTTILLMIIIINIINIALIKPGLFMRLIYFTLFNLGLRFLIDYVNKEILIEFKMSILIITLASITFSLIVSMRLYNKIEFAKF